jgi:hypothetical protein
MGLKDWWAPAISPPEEVLTPVDRVLHEQLRKKIIRHLGGEELAACDIQQKASGFKTVIRVVFTMPWKRMYWMREFDDGDLADWVYIKRCVNQGQLEAQEKYEERNDG